MALKTHPLDPLTPEEIKLTSKIIKTEKPNQWIFNSILLQEPDKDLVLQYEKNSKTTTIPRKSFTVLIDSKSGQVYEVVTNLKNSKIETIIQAPEGSQPTLSPEDCFEAEKIVKNDPGVKQRCKNLGLENIDLVVADPWSIGYTDDADLEGKRLVQLFMYFREHENDNHYAHPLDFVTIVDLIAGKVLRVEDLPIHSDFHPKQVQPVKLARRQFNYDPEFLENDLKFRKDLKPLEIKSPEGPSFNINGNEISWQKFKFRISFNYREGLVLHNIVYDDNGNSRPLFYRAALSEMVVPYGDPRPPFQRKCAFDVGDYGLGFCANSLELGCDCVGTIKYFDAILNTHDGEPTRIKNAVCLHEEDAGILHKHTEYRNGRVVVTRSRKLVISFIVTVVNYEYAIYWKFFQDGTISFEIKATGELSTNLLADNGTPAGYGTIVAPNINGQFHQHIFAMRIDPMIDGAENTVSTLDVLPLSQKFGSPENPHGQGFTVVETPLKTSLQAATDVCPEKFRTWKIWNKSSLHPFTGEPVGWKLIPTSNFAGMLASPESKVRERAGFANHSVWVTRNNKEELYAAGMYVNQSKGGDGLSKWSDRNECVENEDIILWHIFGVTHIPRVEDFPIMPVESCGFALKPVNFFTSNPGLDVPPSNINDGTSKLAEESCCKN